MKWYEAKNIKENWQKQMYGKNNWYDEWNKERSWLEIIHKLEWHVKHYLKPKIDAVVYPGAVVNNPTAPLKSRATCVVLYPAQILVENSPITDSFVVRLKCHVLHGASKKIVSIHHHIEATRTAYHHIEATRTAGRMNVDRFIKSRMEFITESILTDFKLHGNIDDV